MALVQHLVTRGAPFSVAASAQDIVSRGFFVAPGFRALSAPGFFIFQFA
jgi:hypothetical protein